MPLQQGASAQPCSNPRLLSIKRKAETRLPRHLKPFFGPRRSGRIVNSQRQQGEPWRPVETGAPKAFEAAIYSLRQPNLRARRSGYTAEAPRTARFREWQNSRVLARA